MIISRKRAMELLPYFQKIAEAQGAFWDALDNAEKVMTQAEMHQDSFISGGLDKTMDYDRVTTPEAVIDFIDMHGNQDEKRARLGYPR